MTTQTIETGGIIGAVASLKSKLAAKISRHDEIAIALVFYAGVITIFHKAGVPVPYFAAQLIISMGLAALLYEMNATTFALRAFWKGRPFAAIGWSLIWVVAFGYSLNQWIGAASENESTKSNVQKANFVNYQSLTASEAELVKRNNDLLQRISMAPTRTAGQAQAAIDNAKGQKLWKQTDGCTDKSSSSERKFCDAYASAVADAAGAKEHVVNVEEQKVVAKELKAVRDKLSKTDAVSSDERQDFLLLTRWGGMSQQDAGAFNALGGVIAISIFLSFATALKELEHLRNTQTRIPLLGFGWLKRALFGKVHTSSITPLSGTIERRSINGGVIVQRVNAEAAA